MADRIKGEMQDERTDGMRDERTDGMRDERIDGMWDERTDGMRDERTDGMRDERTDEMHGKMKDGRIYIFGAHSRARTLAVYLRFLHPEISVEAFLYDNGEPNPEEADGIPVLCLAECPKLHTEYPVYIGTRGVSHGAITGHLQALGFGSICPVTVGLDRSLRNDYLKQYFASIGREFIKIDDLESSRRGSTETSQEALEENPMGKSVGTCMEDPVKKSVEDSAGKPMANPMDDSVDPAENPSAIIYIVRSAYDSPLDVPYADRPYEKPIQAGAALTSERLSDCGITDDTGENISASNRQFCELTALYWIWKHAKEDIVGMSHYRRRFLLPEDWLGKMLAGKVDVILPVPLYVAPSLSGNYRERHDAADWDCMMGCLKKRDPQEHREAEVFFGKNLYSPCNMFLMRREVLDELCGWLFPILFEAAEQGGTKGDGYQNRYPGFLSERLISFYFERHRRKYRVVYADKNFLA